MKTLIAGIALATLMPAQSVPVPRADANSKLAHEQLLAKMKQGRIDIYFEGDSITRRWDATDYPQFLENWNKNFYGWNAADFGWGADKVENILWRIENGELDGINPRVLVLLAGTNNLGVNPPDEIEKGLEKVVQTMHAKVPDAVIVITAIFPRNDRMQYIPQINQINAELSKMADEKKIRWLNINDKLADADGKLFDGMLNDRDKLHPQLAGYQVWADGLKPIFTEILGPPAQEDHAPPPTGDPSAVKK